MDKAANKTVCFRIQGSFRNRHAALPLAVGRLVAFREMLSILSRVDG
jgi:hypothetical protein